MGEPVWILEFDYDKLSDVVKDEIDGVSRGHNNACRVSVYILFCSFFLILIHIYFF